MSNSLYENREIAAISATINIKEGRRVLIAASQPSICPNPSIEQSECVPKAYGQSGIGIPEWDMWEESPTKPKKARNIYPIRAIVAIIFFDSAVICLLYS